MDVSYKLNTITLHHAKSVLTILFEYEIVDFVHYKQALGNTVTRNKIIPYYPLSKPPFV